MLERNKVRYFVSSADRQKAKIVIEATKRPMVAAVALVDNGVDLLLAIRETLYICQQLKAQS